MLEVRNKLKKAKLNNSRKRPNIKKYEMEKTMSNFVVDLKEFEEKIGNLIKSMTYKESERMDIASFLIKKISEELKLRIDWVTPYEPSNTDEVKITSEICSKYKNNNPIEVIEKLKSKNKLYKSNMESFSLMEELMEITEFMKIYGIELKKIKNIEKMTWTELKIMSRDYMNNTINEFQIDPVVLSKNGMTWKWLKTMETRNLLNNELGVIIPIDYENFFFYLTDEKDNILMLAKINKEKTDVIWTEGNDTKKFWSNILMLQRMIGPKIKLKNDPLYDFGRGHKIMEFIPTGNYLTGICHIEDGCIHYADGPAIIKKDFEGKTSKEWYINGTRHRIDGPAIIEGKSCYWFRYGDLHRDDGPAWISYETTKIKEIEELRKEDNSTYSEEKTSDREYESKIEKFYKNGVLDNKTGPAITISYDDGTSLSEYWINGQELTKDEFTEFLEFTKYQKIRQQEEVEKQDEFENKFKI